MNKIATPPQEFVNSSAVLAPNTKLARKELLTDALSSTALKEEMNATLELVVTPGSASATLVPLVLMMALLLIAHLDHSAQPVLPAKPPMLDFATLQHAMPTPLVLTLSTKRA
jgi:hypothetical protein